MPRAAEHYAALFDANAEQRARVRAGEPPGDRYGGKDCAARRFRYNPKRKLDANLEAIASYVEPGDVVVDVGGGAGRIGLPLALRCKELINVEPSPAMIAEFEACCGESGIANARVVQSGWPPAEAVEGDVVVVTHVTYFVRDIVPFIEALVATARRRVVIAVFDPPPPNMRAETFRVVHGEELALMPGHRELLPVLWDLGILPDVRVLPVPFGAGVGSGAGTPQTPQDAVARQLDDFWLPDDAGRERARQALLGKFDELFMRNDQGYTRRMGQDARELLITWET
jgi:hypothetical protein